MLTSMTIIFLTKINGLDQFLFSRSDLFLYEPKPMHIHTQTYAHTHIWPCVVSDSYRLNKVEYLQVSHEITFSI